MKAHIKKKMKLFIIITSLICALSSYLFLQNSWIDIDHIDVKLENLPVGLKGLKIAHISDVHIPKCASDINNMLVKLRKEAPDIIIMTGDIIDESGDTEDLRFKGLCNELPKIADTYAVTGNHEIWSNNVESWKAILKDNNIKIVEERIEIYEKGDAKIAIMGLGDGSLSYPSGYFNDIESIKGMPKILLAHRPELFHEYDTNSSNIKPDLVFSGHAHGGQFRIPFSNKGIVAPGQGFFPEYTSGLYDKSDGMQMIISRGLGNSIIPIRVNNRPHLPIVILR